MPKSRTKTRGRPPRPMPERIDATPEDIAKAMLSLPPDHKWQYLEREKPARPENTPATK